MVRNTAASGQLVGSWTRMRAMCSITRAPILIRCSRIVSKSAVSFLRRTDGRSKGCGVASVMAAVALRWSTMQFV